MSIIIILDFLGDGIDSFYGQPTPPFHNGIEFLYKLFDLVAAQDKPEGGSGKVEGLLHQSDQEFSVRWGQGAL